MRQQLADPGCRRQPSLALERRRQKTQSRTDAGLSLLAELAPLLQQRTHQLLLTGDHPLLDHLPRSLTATPT
jgi:hypothetical protein